MRHPRRSGRATSAPLETTAPQLALQKSRLGVGAVSRMRGPRSRFEIGWATIRCRRPSAVPARPTRLCGAPHNPLYVVRPIMLSSRRRDHFSAAQREIGGWFAQHNRRPEQGLACRRAGVCPGVRPIARACCYRARVARSPPRTGIGAEGSAVVRSPTQDLVSPDHRDHGTRAACPGGRLCCPPHWARPGKRSSGSRLTT
jgi:hypothetical protein